MLHDCLKLQLRLVVVFIVLIEIFVNCLLSLSHIKYRAIFGDEKTPTAQSGDNEDQSTLHYALLHGTFFSSFFAIVHFNLTTYDYDRLDFTTSCDICWHFNN
jgi:hypothetical protein